MQRLQNRTPRVRVCELHVKDRLAEEAFNAAAQYGAVHRRSTSQPRRVHLHACTTEPTNGFPGEGGERGGREGGQRGGGCGDCGEGEERQSVCTPARAAATALAAGSGYCGSCRGREFSPEHELGILPGGGEHELGILPGPAGRCGGGAAGGGAANAAAGAANLSKLGGGKLMGGEPDGMSSAWQPPSPLCVLLILRRERPA